MNKQRDHAGGLAGIVFGLVLLVFAATSLAQGNTTANLKQQFRQSLSPDEVEWLVSHPIIRVQNEQDSVPYNFFQDGPKGHSIDYIHLLADIIGIEVKFITGPKWHEFLSMMEQRQLDVMTNIVNTQQRTQFIHFTKPYKKLLEGIYIKQGGQSYKSLAELKGKKVAIVKGFYQHELIKKYYPEIELQLVHSNLAAIEAVLTGDVDATFSDSALINYLMKQNTVGGIVLSSFNHDKRFENVVSLGVRKDWLIFRDILQKAMVLVPQQQLDQLYNKWHGDNTNGSEQALQPITVSDKASSFTHSLMSLNTLIAIIVLASALLVMFWLMSRWLLSSKKNPLAFQFSSRVAKRMTGALNIVLIISATILAWWALETINRKFKEDVRDSLRTVVRTTMETIEIWAKDQKLSVRKIAMDPEISQLAQLQYGRFRKGQLKFGGGDDTTLSQRFAYHQSRSGNLDFTLMTNDGVILSSNYEDLLGKKSSIFRYRPELFRRVLKGETLLIPPVPAAIPLQIGANITGLGRPSTMFVASPVRDSERRIIGIIAQRLNPAAEFSRLHLLGRLGASGETYSIDKKGKMLSNSRFNAHLLKVGLIERGDQSILSIDVRDPGGNLLDGHQNDTPKSQWPLTLMAQINVTQGEGFNVDGYRDYRGIKVLGAWLWSDEVGFGIATEIDEKEALEPYAIARIAILVTLLVTVCVAIMFGLFVMVLGNRANQALQLARDQLEVEVQSRTKELRQALNDIDEQRFVLDQHAIVAVTDLRGTITYANQKFAQISGYTIEELVGQNHRILSSGTHDETFWRGMYDEIKRGGVWHDEVCNRAKDGELYWVETTIAAFRDESGRPKAYVAIRTDISGRKRYESELHQAKTIAESANQAKSDFLASMSHEIRTPLNGILGMLGLVKKSALDSEQQHRIGVASTCAQSLLTLINDILDFSKIEAGKLELEQIDFDLIDLLEDIAKAQAFQCNEKSIELLLNVSKLEHCYVVGDPTRLRQILFNLISNAIKFTHHGEIRIDTQLQRLDKERLRFTCTVSDTGIGIPADRVDTLFESFTQVDASTTRKYGGTGLGLAICKRLCELCNGDIRLESELGKGSRFSFTLEYGVGKETDKPRFKVNINTLNILIVDDNVGSCEILTQQLHSWGATVESLQDVPRAIDRLEHQQEDEFDLILIDMDMPNMDGELLTTYLRSNSKYDSLKIIMMADIAQIKRIEALTTIGLNGYLVKPVSISDLYDMLLPIAAGEDYEFSFTSIKPGTRVGISHKKAVNQSKQYDLNVLLVEDNEINQLVVTGMLESTGMVIDIADNGEVAIQALRNSSTNRPYDVIFMDCQMPVLDGFQTTEQIRQGGAGGRYKDVAIVALTANALVEDKQKCLDAGMSDYLVKPIDEDKLFEVLSKWQNQLLPLKQAKAEDARPAYSVDGIEVKNDKSIEIPSGLNHFDQQSAVSMAVFTPRAYVKSLQLYIKQYQSFSQQLAQAASEDEMTYLLHTLKGICGNLQLNVLYNSTKSVEIEYSRSGVFERSRLSELQTLVNQSVKEAKTVIKANSRIFDVDHFRPFDVIKAELLSKLDQSELINPDLIDEFRASAKQADTDLPVERIIGAMEDFDYEAAGTLLKP